METIDEVLQETLSRYYNVLTVYGYCNYEDVYRILVGLFLNNLLYSLTFNQFVNEADYRIITNTLYQLYGSTCLIPYPEFISYSNLLESDTKGYIPRVTEEDNLRSTETETLRTA